MHLLSYVVFHFVILHLRNSLLVLFKTMLAFDLV